MTNRELATEIVEWHRSTRSVGEPNLVDKITDALNEAEARGRKHGLEEAAKKFSEHQYTVEKDQKWAEQVCLELFGISKSSSTDCPGPRGHEFEYPQNAQPGRCRWCGQSAAEGAVKKS